MYKHNCIKPSCRSPYESEEIDAYYCPKCNEERLVKAAEIDAKVGSTVGQQPNGLYSQYERARAGGKFVSAEALMNFQ